MQVNHLLMTGIDQRWRFYDNLARQEIGSGQ